MRPQLVAYTTFRPVVTACYSPCAPACSPCGTAPCGTGCSPCGTGGAPAATVTPTFYAPATTVAPAPGCCGTASTAPPATTYAAAPPATYGVVPPAAYGVAPAATYTSAPAPAVVPQGAPGTPLRTLPSTPVPTIAPDANVPRTFTEPDANGNGSPQSYNMAPRVPNTNAGAPRYLDPEGQDRVTMMPLRQAQLVKPVSAGVAANAGDNGGWRAATK